MARELSDSDDDSSIVSDDLLFREVMDLGFPLIEMDQDKVNKLFRNSDCLFSEVLSKKKCKTGFELGNLLNDQGNQSKVYNSNCGTDDKYVAKLYKFDKIDKNNFFKEVVNQIKIFNIDSNNPIAPQIYEIILCKNQKDGKYNQAIIIMDILDGNSLEKYLTILQQSGNKREILTILNKVKEIFTKLYSKNWAHGDVHTNNIFVTNNSKKIYLLDFDRSSYVIDKNRLNILKKIEMDGLIKLLLDLLGSDYQREINEIFTPLIRGVDVFSLSEAVSRTGNEMGKRIITFGTFRKNARKQDSSDSDRDSDRKSDRKSDSDRKSGRDGRSMKTFFDF